MKIDSIPETNETLTHGRIIKGGTQEGERTVSLITWKKKPSVLKEIPRAEEEFKSGRESRALANIWEGALEDHLDPFACHLVVPHTWAVQPTSRGKGESLYLISDYLLSASAENLTSAYFKDRPLEVVTQMFDDIYLAVTTLRRWKLIHHDIETYNILITPNDRAYLCDLDGMHTFENERENIIKAQARWDKVRPEEDPRPILYSADIDGLFMFALFLGMSRRGITDRSYVQEQDAQVYAYMAECSKNFELADPEKVYDLIESIL